MEYGNYGRLAGCREEAAMGDAQRKTTLYEQFARIGKALGSPRRLELLDLLAQGERSVQPAPVERTHCPPAGRRDARMAAGRPALHRG